MRAWDRFGVRGLPPAADAEPRTCTTAGRVRHAGAGNCPTTSHQRSHPGLSFLSLSTPAQAAPTGFRVENGR
ncbi:hypothetical protein, partial [Streptomyces sp. NPDC006140]|uniref:hypothetical protein n=1 Tax=Streptomyces sp. NPDC006140 TaxID=3154579 RepID=UPI0034014461